MSTAFQGDYTSDLFNPSKRYRMQFQTDKVFADSEAREIQDVSDSYIRQLVHNNFPRGSSTNDGFKVEESGSDTINNFTVKGGDGTAIGAGLLFVDGFILFLKSDIEYKNQDNTGALTDDDYTESTIAALTTPGGARTDEVYVDFYFAEVSNDVGSEYQDTSLAVTGIGTTTANRIRMVQDVLVAESGVTPTDVTDANSIDHKYIKIATLNRLSGNNTITTAMITDNRTVVNPISENTSHWDLSGSDLSNNNSGKVTINPNVLSGGDFEILSETSGTTFFADVSQGYVGIGTDSPEKILHTQGSNVKFERTTVGPNNAETTVAEFKGTTTSGSMTDGFGTLIRFFIEDDAAVEKEIGRIKFLRDGADNEGKFVVETGTNGREDAFSIDAAGATILNVSSLPGGDVTMNHDTGTAFFMDATNGIITTNRVVAERTNTTTGLADPPIIVKKYHNTNMADGYGVGINFQIEDDSAVTNALGNIGFVRDGADNEGKFILQGGTDGGEEFLTIDADGVVDVNVNMAQTIFQVVNTTPGLVAPPIISKKFHSGNMADGFGTYVSFQIEDSTSGTLQIGGIGY
ncbi:MAG: hypothetical protein ACTSQA_08860, partial [Candidatus Heimdallarchaeaceae archaeon]